MDTVTYRFDGKTKTLPRDVFIAKAALTLQAMGMKAERGEIASQVDKILSGDHNLSHIGNILSDYIIVDEPPQTETAGGSRRAAEN